MVPLLFGGSDTTAVIASLPKKLSTMTTTYSSTSYGDLDSKAKRDVLQGFVEDSEPDTVKRVIAHATRDKQEAAVEGAGQVLSGISGRERKSLYMLVIIILAVLAAGALAGGGVAMMAGKESAAFFTFAGLALGGITALFAPSPLQKGG